MTLSDLEGQLLLETFNSHTSGKIALLTIIRLHINHKANLVCNFNCVIKTEVLVLYSFNYNCILRYDTADYRALNS